MDAQTYFNDVLENLSRSEPSQVVEQLRPLLYIPSIKAVASPSTIALHADNGYKLLSGIGERTNWEKVNEAFMGLSALKALADATVRGTIGALSTVAAVTLIADKDRLKGVVAELKQLKNPKNLIAKEYPLANNTPYPLQKPVITFDDVDKLLRDHISALKVFSSFVNASKFHVTTLPELNQEQWIAPLKSLGGSDTADLIQTDVLFGNIQVTLTRDTKGKTWKVAKVSKPNASPPRSFTIPRPFTLGAHIKNARAYLEDIWKVDSDLSKAVTDINAMLDRSNGKTPGGKLIRETIGIFYTNILTSSLEISMAYSKLVEFAATKYGIK